MAHVGHLRRSRTPDVRERDGHPYLPGSPLRLRAHRPASVLRNPEKPPDKYHASAEPSCTRDGVFYGRSRSGHQGELFETYVEHVLAPAPAAGSTRGDGQP